MHDGHTFGVINVNNPVDGRDYDAGDLQLGEHPYVLSQPLGMTYQVSKLPFALLIGADGSLQSKGLVNTREHLESLVEAMDTGIATLQDYVSQAADTDLDTPVKEQSL